MPKRVLVEIPSNNSFKFPRYVAVSVEAANDYIRLAQEGESSWYFGARIVDESDYARYGFKSCPLNGVVQDPGSTNLARVRYLEAQEAAKKASEISEATQSSIEAKLRKMEAELAMFRSDAIKSSAQKDAEKRAELETAALDKESVKKVKSK